MIAFVDESYNAERYLLAAVILDEWNVEQVRAQSLLLRLRGQKKLHWRNENQRRRNAIASAVGRLEVSHLVVVRGSRSGERTERQRRRCLEVLVSSLDVQNVTLVVLESRSHTEDKSDRDLVDAMLAKKVISRSLRIGHAKGSDEPALWVADAVCGMTVAHLDGDSRYLEPLLARGLIEIRKISSP